MNAARLLGICVVGLMACGEPEPTPMIEATRTRLEATPGTYRFDLAWTADTVGAMGIEGSLALDGTLEIAIDDALSARIALAEVRSFTVDVAGDRQTDPALAEPLEGCHGWIDLDDGPPKELRTTPDVSEGCRHVLSSIATSIDLRDEVGRRSVPTAYGVLEAEYEAEILGVRRVVQGTSGPWRAEGHATVELDGRGRPERIASKLWLSSPDLEAAPVATTAFELERTAWSPTLPVPASGEIVAVSLLPTITSEEATRREALAYADGMSRGMLGLWIAHADRGGRLPDGFAIQARGAMIAEPALAEDVAGAFATVTSSAGRQLVVDLLSQAGTPAARRALRRVVADAVAVGAEDRGLLLQRIGLLDSPDAASLGLVLRLHDFARDSHDPSLRAATLYVLGMLATLDEPDLRDRAEAARGRLAEGLADDDPVIRRAAMAGLGNLRDASLASVIAAHLVDPEESVRAGATLALRGMPAELAMPIVERLRTDPSPFVADAARIAQQHLELSQDAS